MKPDHTPPNTDPLEVITHPEIYYRAPATLQYCWSELKAARGQPITPDRMQRLSPNYGISEPRHYPTAREIEKAHADARAERCLDKIRKVATARGYSLRSLDPSDGSAA